MTLEVIKENIRRAPASSGPSLRYEPRTPNQALGYLVEEAGEVLAAAGKSIRWGLDSYNPEIPLNERETNRDWLFRELQDLKAAIERVEKLCQ